MYATTVILLIGILMYIAWMMHRDEHETFASADREKRSAGWGWEWAQRWYPWSGWKGGSYSWGNRPLAQAK